MMKTRRNVYRIDCYFRVERPLRRRGKRYYNALAPRCGDQRFLIGRLRACASATSGSRGVLGRYRLATRDPRQDSSDLLVTSDRLRPRRQTNPPLHIAVKQQKCNYFRYSRSLTKLNQA